MKDIGLDTGKPTAKKIRWRRIFAKRMLLGYGFIVFLAFFLHFRDAPMENLDLGTQATRYTISQIDFEFPDEESTVILRQEALRDVGSIYKIDDKQVQQRRSAFENFLLHNSSWRSKLKESTFEDLHRAADSLEKGLLRSRFTDARTFKKLEELHQDTAVYFVYQPPSFEEADRLPLEFWRKVEQRAFLPKDYPEETVRFILGFFEKETWLLEVDWASDRIVRQLVQDTVPVVYTHVDAGSRLIDPGERVTSRHIEMLKAMQRALGEIWDFWDPMAILGSFLLAILFTSLGYVYLSLFHRNLLKSFQKLFLLLSVLSLTMFLSKMVEFALRNKETHLIDLIHYPLFVPLATILICVLVGSEVALISSIFVGIMLQLSFAIDGHTFLVINLFTAFVILIGARGIHKRKEIFKVCGFAWVCAVPVVCGFHLMHHDIWDPALLLDIVSTFIFMLATALIALAVLPLFESLFHVMTDMTLMEYMDPNNPLLRRLSLEAPGTYQHSLVIGNLAEEAALSIGANALFCRVATLYHDIGKLFNPHYFTENQLGGFNIHQLLTPQESAQVILAHITEGELLARKHGLPQSFIDIIREHHGMTLVYYFYCKQVELMGDVAKVDEKKFRYPGPKPHSKESAIIMIADTVEAASRSLEEINETTLEHLIHRLVSDKISDGQLDDTSLTFEELGMVKHSMVKTLCAACHLRVKYPEKVPSSV